MNNLDSSEAIRTLVEQAAIRPIVPFLGAGVSVSAGFPAIRSIVHYLAKVEFAIEFGVFSHRYPGFTKQVDSEQLYRDHPSRFLKDFGWPELGHLDADLWAWLDEYHAKNVVEDRLSKGLFANLKGTEPRDRLRLVVQWMLHRDLSFREWTAAERLKEVWKAADSPDLKLFWGDWETLLDRLSEGSLDLTDELFSALEHGRSPTIAHRYLAFLQSKLGMPLVLTTNFDSLLERAMQQEGITAKVFSVHRDAELPEPALVRAGLGILKLHGSTYGLRVGERLKYPLEAKARKAVLQCIPNDAMLLVMGFGGNERRIMQLFHAVAKDRRYQSGRGKRGVPKLRILWLKTGGESTFLRQLREESGDTVRVANITDVNMFLQQTYFHFAGGYQASTVGYPVLLSRPFIAPQPQIIASQPQKPSPPRPIQIFDASDSTNQESWGTLAAAQFIAERRYDYNPIWIDLETHHTVTGVIAELFDQIHQFDPHAPELTLIEEPDELASKAVLRKVVDRINEAFQRGRYIVVFDSLESFARPQMSHHGTPTYSLFKQKSTNAIPFSGRYDTLFKVYTTRVTALKNFLLILLGLKDEDTNEAQKNEDKNKTQQKAFRDSYICVTMDRPFPASSRKSDTLLKMLDAIREIKNGANVNSAHVQQWTPKTLPVDGYSNLSFPTKLLQEAAPLKASLKHFKAISQFKQDLYSGIPATSLKDDGPKLACILLLSLFRRPRPIPVLRAMLSRWALQPQMGVSQPEARTVNAALDSVLDLIGNVTRRREGDILWMYREIHHRAWQRLTCNTRPAEWIVRWQQPGDDTGPLATAAFIDGMTVIAWHLAAARVYYADVFMPTKDISAFYEYLYHRVAALRDIALLLAISKMHFKDILAGLESHGLTLEAICDTTGAFSSLGERAQSKENDSFLERLGKLRDHGLSTLLRALERNRDFIRAKSPPDTLLAWSQQFLDRDIDELSGSIYELAFIPSEWTGEIKPLFGNEMGVEGLRRFFEELKCQEYTTKLDYLSALECLNIGSPSTVDYQTRLCKQIGVGNVAPDNDSDEATWSKYVQRARCFLHLGVGDYLAKQSDYEVILPPVVKTDSSLTYKKVVRDAMEVRTKTRLARVCLMWHGLDRDKRTWVIANHPGENLESVDVKRQCQDCIDAATEYERWVREISENREEDARHRSSALVSRARAEYLQGRFRQAHQLLDVAPAGLLRDRVDHQVAGAIVHLHRAELLLYSADYHFTHPDAMPNPSAAKELRKVARAESELAVAEECLRDVKHQAGWRMGLHVGWAQTRLERLLFELEVLWRLPRRLDQTQYSRRTGEMERILLHGMRHLRNALDLLPYRPEQWEDIKGEAIEYSPLIKTERKVYSLWCSYFIVSGVYWTLLYQRHSSQTSDTLLRNFLGTQAEFSKKQWVLWCHSLRFDQFAEFNLPLSNIPERKSRRDMPVSLRDEVIRIMRELVRGSAPGGEDPIEEMWNRRRPKTTGGSPSFG